jgi:hypothetical protein
MNEDNFHSIDRLVEFGLGMAVARQMVNSMNHALSNGQVPGPMNQVKTASSPTYFVVHDGKPAGPFSEQELARLIMEGKVVKTTYVWRPGFAKWQVAEELPDVLRLVALCPPPLP